MGIRKSGMMNGSPFPHCSAIFVDIQPAPIAHVCLSRVVSRSHLWSGVPFTPDTVKVVQPGRVHDGNCNGWAVDHVALSRCSWIDARQRPPGSPAYRLRQVRHTIACDDTSVSIRDVQRSWYRMTSGQESVRATVTVPVAEDPPAAKAVI